MAVISVENLTHTYSVGTPFEKTAIRDINVTLTQGECVFILGHTGSGKSTFVQHLNALLQPTGGTVKIDGADINKDKISRRDVKRRVGLVFQYPEYQLFEETVAEDIAFGPKNMKLTKRSTSVFGRRRALWAWRRAFSPALRWTFPEARSEGSPLPA